MAWAAPGLVALEMLRAWAVPPTTPEAEAEAEVATAQGQVDVEAVAEALAQGATSPRLRSVLASWPSTQVSASLSRSPMRIVLA